MAVAVNTSRFEGVAMKLNLLSEAFKADTNDMKLNLGVGAYRTEELQPYVLNVVKKAENLMLKRGDNKEYLPIEGLDAFNKVTAELLFGVDNVVIQQGGVEKVKQDIKNKDGQIKKMEETIYSLDVKNKGKDLINKNLQEKVKELESQLLIDRKLARQHVDAKIAEKQKEK